MSGKNIFKTHVSHRFMAKDKTKDERILSALKGSPNGLWVREIARKTSLDKSTVSRHLAGMNDRTEFSFLGRNKVFRLRK